MYTREQWCIAVLEAIGNKNPTQNVINWLVGWTLFETNAGSGASYNLLNTTLRMPGSTNFNSAGVQNFVSFDQGIEANASTLANGFYGTIFSALKNNLQNTLMTGTAVIDSELSKWGTGAVQRSIIASMGKGLEDQFLGKEDMVTGVPEGWSDDGKTLRAPDGKYEVTEGYRDWILTHNWDSTNWPICSSTGSSSLEASNPSIGAGTYQDFRKNRLEWTEQTGVIECYLGVEYEFVMQQRNALQQQVNNDQILIANLKSGLPKDLITNLSNDCQSLLSKLQGLT